MSSDSEAFSDSDDEVRDAFAKGLIKPGLNFEVPQKKPLANNVTRLNSKCSEIRLNMDWIERLDLVNEPAPLAPEMTLQLEKEEQKRANMFAGNAKLKYHEPSKDPVLNDFKREMLFHRQAQAAAVEGIRKLHALGVATKRPDDYFAEMAKTDAHMQKVRQHLLAKQEGQAKSEKVRQIREQRKMGKKMQQQARLRKEKDKKETLDKLKKFRKGKLQNLDFLEDAKGQTKRQAKDKKFGFGGKKRGKKQNDRKSSMGVSAKFRGGKGGKGVKGGKVTKRPGKSQRNKGKTRRK
ncbi:probable rRNA-processing protein EBP2 homolog [Phlebotomus argentipes]|uniref:probable rRNA-processing protein EBP2 homolog n=1 Tax=Phlebotomus argentipes TaxID=94469 RepID=UPI0028933996|nr:probable rRNA-processing protein EBP2 homolog [Phlebotomus argentipes]